MKTIWRVKNKITNTIQKNQGNICQYSLVSPYAL